MHLNYDAPPTTIEELRRQLRDNEITLHGYKVKLAQLAEPAEALCATPGCTRQAYRLDRGKAVCAVCLTMAETQRRRGW